MNRFTKWFPVILIAGGILAYANSFSAPFILDDSRVITGNPNIHTLWPPWKAVYVPTRWVADISFAVNLAISGFTPADFRMTNILIHILAGLLLYGIVRGTLRLPRFEGRFEESADWLALATALLWTVHPLQTGCVTYIAQRIEALMGLFYLATFYCFTRAVGSPNPRRWISAAVALCAAGMGTKEVMATAPLMVFIYDGLLVSSSWSEALRRRWKTHLALFLTIGIFALLFLMGIGIAAEQNTSLLGRMVSPWRYLLTQTEVITHYLRLSFVPTQLCLSYRWPIAKGLLDVWPTACFISALGIVTLAGLVRRKVWAFPLVWLFVILAPTSSILPIPDAAFDHRMYLPLAGVLALTFAGWHCVVQYLHNRFGHPPLLLPALWIPVVGIAVWFAFLTAARNSDYRSEETIWRDVIRKRPSNCRGYVALSATLIRQGQDDTAIHFLNRVLAILPDYSKQSRNSIVQQQDLDPSVPILEYTTAHSLLGAACLNTGHTNESILHLREALRVDPTRPTPYLNLGRIAMAQKKYQESLSWLRYAHLYKPNDQDTLCIMASVYAIQKNWVKSIEHYETVLKINPTMGFARAQLAWTLATCPDAGCRNGPRAVELALPLISMTQGYSPRAYDILAAAYAEAGKYDKAVQHAKTAIQLLEKHGDSAISPDNASVADDALHEASLLEQIRQRITLYRQQTPFRDTP